jgi:vancomycin permeability regulator SanA
MQRRSRPKRVASVIVAGIAAFAATAAWIAYDGLTDELAAADVGIVLGSMVELNGQPSARLAARLDEAASLYGRGLFRTVIVSGATGAEGYDEAAVMASYLVAHGVPQAAVVLDHNGSNTNATARNAVQLMKDRGLHSALVVSQYFHITRARLALQKYDVPVAGAAHAPFFEPRDVYSLAREVIALWAYLLPLQPAGLGDN